MNIGLEVLNTGAVQSSPSLETLFGQYIECEQFAASTEKFSAYGDQLMIAFDNIVSLGKTAAKFSSNEAMAVINSLVENDFHGQFSSTEAKSAAKSIWQRIGEWFKKIFTWIKEFFYRVLNFFGGAKKRLEAMLADYKKAKAPCKEWKFNGITAQLDSSNSVVKAAMKLDEITQKLEAGSYDKEEKVDADLKKALENLDKRQQEYIVKTNTDAKKVIKEAIDLLNGIPKTEKSTKKLYDAANKVYSKASTEEDIKKAKIAQKAASAAVKLDHAWATPIMRTIASIMANGKYKSIKD